MKGAAGFLLLTNDRPLLVPVWSSGPLFYYYATDNVIIKGRTTPNWNNQGLSFIRLYILVTCECAVMLQIRIDFRSRVAHAHALSTNGERVAYALIGEK